MYVTFYSPTSKKNEAFFRLQANNYIRMKFMKYISG